METSSLVSSVRPARHDGCASVWFVARQAPLKAPERALQGFASPWPAAAWGRVRRLSALWPPQDPARPGATYRRGPVSSAAERSVSLDMPSRASERRHPSDLADAREPSRSPGKRPPLVTDVQRHGQTLYWQHKTSKNFPESGTLLLQVTLSSYHAPASRNAASFADPASRWLPGVPRHQCPASHPMPSRSLTAPDQHGYALLRGARNDTRACQPARQ